MTSLITKLWWVYMMNLNGSELYLAYPWVSIQWNDQYTRMKPLTGQNFCGPTRCGQKEDYSYSYRPASVSQCHAHSRAVVFHTLYIFQRDTILCPWISYRSILFTIHCCSVPRVLLYFPSFTLLSRPLPPSPLPLPAPLPYQVPPVINTLSLIAHPEPFMTPT